MKTNGARFLESLNIPFELREYEVDPEDLSAITVAKKIGMPDEQVFKTLLTTDGAHDFVFAVIPGDAALDFKKLARLAQWRKAEMAPLKDVQPLTGYIRGGVTVFGARKPYPIYVDETAILFDRIGQPVQTADLTKAATPSSNQNDVAPSSNQNDVAPSYASRPHGETPRVGDQSHSPSNPNHEGQS